MISSLSLYHSSAEAITARVVETSVQLLDFSRLEVSRMIGRANYFEINKQLLAITGPCTISGPPEDISDKVMTAAGGLGALWRPGSVLSVQIIGSERLRRISNAITNDVPEGGRGFYISGAGISFGPMDSIAFTENEEGDDDVELIDITQFKLDFACDDFRGSARVLIPSLGEIPEFAKLRSELEEIVGPLRVHFKY